MIHDGPGFYDDPQLFATYIQRRDRIVSANETLEFPVFAKMLGDVAGHDVLDLGCGNGKFGRQLREAGATSYTGVDASINMIDAARGTLSDQRVQLIHATLQDFVIPEASFTRITARLVLHYLEDIGEIFAKVATALKPGGLFVFSVEHSVITSSAAAATDTGVRQDWIVDDYFVTGRRVTDWMGGRVIKYHRTVEHYFAAVQASGLSVEALRESDPVRTNFTDEELFLRRQRIPLFLLIAARKPLAGA